MQLEKKWKRWDVGHANAYALRWHSYWARLTTYLRNLNTYISPSVSAYFLTENFLASVARFYGVAETNKPVLSTAMHSHHVRGVAEQIYDYEKPCISQWSQLNSLSLQHEKSSYLCSYFCVWLIVESSLGSGCHSTCGHNTSRMPFDLNGQKKSPEKQCKQSSLMLPTAKCSLHATGLLYRLCGNFQKLSSVWEDTDPWQAKSNLYKIAPEGLFDGEWIFP